MATTQLQEPFGDEPFEEVELKRAPLARVLAQLRFEQLSALQSSRAFEHFSSSLGEAYPYVEHSSEAAMILSGGQVVQQPTATPVLRLKSPEKTDVINLSNGSLSFETTSYRGHGDFCEKLKRAANALCEATKIPAYVRLGVRFTNRISSPDILQNLNLYIRPEILGVSGVKLGGGAEIQHTLSQASFRTGEGAGLLAQWGEMPPNGTFDPTLPALAVKSWVLDFDAFLQGEQLSSDPDNVLAGAESLAAQVYRFFRWAVTPEFIEEFRE